MNQSDETAEKIERLRRVLAEQNLGGVLINSQPNFAWLTAGGSNAVDISRENGSSSLLIRRDGKKFVLASKIEMPRVLAEEVSANDFEPIEFAWQDEKGAPDFLAKLAKSLLLENANLGADIAIGADAAVIEGAVAQSRFQLTAAEIERYRELGRDAGSIIGETIKNCRPGQTEREIAALVTNALAAKNIRPVVMLVAADERLQNFRHPVPTDKRWRETLMIVVCAKRSGLIASLSRIAAAGTVSNELQQRTEAAARVNAKLLAATKPDADGAELYRIAADAYAAEGFADEIILHHQGGATGYRTRDWAAHPASRDKVQVNQAFAWNPSIAGTKIEETVIASADKTEIITASPDFPQIVIEIAGREYSAPGILSL